MGHFCLELLTLPPRLQQWESVGVISSAYCRLEKEKPWSQIPAGGTASGDMLGLQHGAAAPLDTQRSPCALRLATEENKSIYIISLYMAKSNFEEFRSLHKHRFFGRGTPNWWQRGMCPSVPHGPPAPHLSGKGGIGPCGRGFSTRKATITHNLCSVSGVAARGFRHARSCCRHTPAASRAQHSLDSDRTQSIPEQEPSELCWQLW